MRIYVPATLADLSAPDLSARLVSTVTPELIAALPAHDDEERELSAFLTAADTAVLLIARDQAEPLRAVVAADVPEEALAAADLPEGDALAPIADLPSVRRMTRSLAWSDVASLHVDDAEAAPHVVAALGGDEDSFEALGEVDLLWFDVSERGRWAGRQG